MKKLFAAALALLLLLCACGRKPEDTADAGPSSYLDPDPAALIDSVYEKLAEGTETSKFIPQLVTESITAKNEEYYLGISGIPYTKGAASEAFVQPVTYSFSVIVLEEGVDYDAHRKTIERNLNKSKWVCAAAAEALTVRYGNVIAVIMGPEKVCAELETAFLGVVGK